MPHTRPNASSTEPHPSSLTSSLQSVLSALGAGRLGVARRLAAGVGSGGPAPFSITAVVDADGPVEPKETALPLGAFGLAFERGGHHLWPHQTREIRVWSYPDDALPQVAFVASWSLHAARPGPLQQAAAEEGLEALARRWQGAPRQGPSPAALPAATDSAGRWSQECPAEAKELLGGVALAWASLRRACGEAARGQGPALLRGEPGTGKQRLAGLLHRWSRRGPLVQVDCRAHGSAEQEAVLFALPRGAAAVGGAALRSAGGTLVLNHVDHLTRPNQARVMSLLENAFLRGTKGERIPVETRLVATTEVDLQERVQSGSFRADLLWQLRVFDLKVPPLRACAEDIPQMLAAEYRQISVGRTLPGLSQRAQKLVCEYSWPGNRPQLRAEATRLWLLHPGATRVTEAMLSPALREPGGLSLGDLSHPMALRRAVALVEELMIRRALSCAEGNKTRAARSLCLSRQGLYKKMARLGL